MPILRQELEDFEVDEIPLESPSDRGEHVWVRIEKRDLTTHRLARELAHELGVRPRDVGWAGRKDRRAVTRQWLSLPGVALEAVERVRLPDVEILEARYHRRKLRLGDLAGNRFSLVLRECRAESVEGLGERLRQAERAGLPNRFGRQRFGRHGDNAERGAALLSGEERIFDLRTARFLLSALQSEVFNRVLGVRMAGDDAWRELRDGDIAVEHRGPATGRLFTVQGDLSELNERVARFEISATGPMFGTKAWQPHGRTLEEERSVLRELGLPEDPRTLDLPRGLRLPGGRRSLRSRVLDVELEELGSSVEGDSSRVDLRLAMTLDPGVFATTVVEELFPEEPVLDAARESARESGRGGDADARDED